SVVFDLQPGFELVATVSGPRVHGLSELHWSEDAQRWVVDGANRGLDKESSSVRFTGLPAGRYRAQTEFGQESDEVTLDATHPSATVRIEADPVVLVSGRVEGPRDMDPKLVQIAVRIENGREREFQCGPDATFSFELAAGCRAFVAARHPFLA